jgi:hypothetical protein
MKRSENYDSSKNNDFSPLSKMLDKWILKKLVY